MENKTLPGYEKLEGSDYEITGNTSQLSNSKMSLSYQAGTSADEIILDDFLQEEIFVLSEEYVLMEGEFVMWQGMAPSRAKSKKNNLENDSEGQLIFAF